MSIPRKEATTQLTKAPLKKDIPKIDEIWDFIFKTCKPRNQSID